MQAKMKCPSNKTVERQSKLHVPITGHNFAVASEREDVRKIEVYLSVLTRKTKKQKSTTC